MTKKLIKEFKTIAVCEFDGTLQNLQNKIKDLIDEGWVNINVDGFSDYDAFELSKLRLETDEEYEVRIIFENKRQANEEKRERETFLKLKKKFEPS